MTDTKKERGERPTPLEYMRDRMVTLMPRANQIAAKAQVMILEELDAQAAAEGMGPGDWRPVDLVMLVSTIAGALSAVVEVNGVAAMRANGAPKEVLDVVRLGGAKAVAAAYASAMDHAAEGGIEIERSKIGESGWVEAILKEVAERDRAAEMGAVGRA